MAPLSFRFSRHFGAVSAVSVLLLLAVYFWGFQTFIYFEMLHLAAQHPIVRVTPQSPLVESANSAPGTKLAYSQVAFEVPWSGLDAQGQKVINNIAVFPFRSGQVVTVFTSGAGREGGLLSALNKQYAALGLSTQQLFGAEATKSNYAFQNAILALTPAALRPWTSRQDATRISILLTIKGISTSGGETGIFRVASSDWKGFQFGDPSKKPRRIVLELYDSNDRYLGIIFSTRNNPAATITQADVNRVVRSLSSDRKLAEVAELITRAVASR